MTDLDHDPDRDDDLQNLQVKVAYLELRIADLETALAREARENGQLAERLDILERARTPIIGRLLHEAGQWIVVETYTDPVDLIDAVRAIGRTEAVVLRTRHIRTQVTA